MHRTRRIWVGAVTTVLACAVLIGTATAERHRKRGAHPAAAKPAAPVSDGAPLGERVREMWVFYRALADWQLRSGMSAASYDVARRALAVTGALASANPGAAITAALTPEPSVLEQRPVAGDISSGYGVRRDPFARRRHKKHNGVDLRAERGVPVHAAGPGMVARAERMRGYGRVVYVDHGGGVETRYAHLQKISVQEGQFVAPGELVGKVGSSGRSTGPHLHFEVRENGRPVAPVEILGLLAAQAPLVASFERLLDGTDPAATDATDGADQVTRAPARAKKPHAKKSRGSKRGRTRPLRSHRPNS
ncbi:MAG TPA: M23 family metallopeptidase [Kofleriaceae bacterium]|nr:M23 family metallopeptidase [Kofleriaceae bacterium]